MTGRISALSLPAMRPLPPGRACTVSVVDIGSDKICCIVAKLKPRARDRADSQRSHDIQVLGVGYHRSAGIKSGVIMDMEAAEGAIRRAVEAAERMAGTTIESVIANVSCGRIMSETFSANVETRNTISEKDVHRVLAAGRAFSLEEGRTVIHSLPIGYALDGQRGVSHPVGMVGETLGVDMNVISADASPVRNLILCLERCHLEVEALVASPYASALGAISEDEARLGTACLDIGAGTTNLSVFFEGSIVFADNIAIGGQHVTMDLARGLSTNLGHAERIKALYGSALPADSDDGEMINVPRVGTVEEEDVVPTPRAMINAIIRPRVEEILEIMRDRMRASGAEGVTGRRLVMTGGGSMQTGIIQLAESILSCRARVGRPGSIEGLPEQAHAPAFSAALGLLVYPQVAQIEHFEADSVKRGLAAPGHYLARVGRWLKESF
ncbi:MAG: cell division protein FtsA [Pseudomonadota bacterium]